MVSYLTDQHRHFPWCRRRLHRHFRCHYLTLHLDHFVWCRSRLHRHFRLHYLTLLHLDHFVFSSDFLPLSVGSWLVSNYV
ncbi:hypothetical protein ACJIZ3_006506 [Penstemon smallii]|uniref:Uncharacterized protein n=1 Tax=Penstemon smallii TaxID=265156 RepID=A0ABD3S843_9LAMI